MSAIFSWSCKFNDLSGIKILCTFFQIDRLIESFDVIADLLKYHHHSNSPFDLEASEHQGPGDLIQHRLVYVGISVFMTKLLKALVPVEKVRYEAKINFISITHLYNILLFFQLQK